MESRNRKSNTCCGRGTDLPSSLCCRRGDVCVKYYSREINVYDPGSGASVQPVSYYLMVCSSTHRRGRTWGFLCSWARWRCRPALLWSTWLTAGSASGGGGSSTPEPPSQTRPASCPLEGEEQNHWWIYTIILHNLVCIIHSLIHHQFQQKLILVFLLLSPFFEAFTSLFFVPSMCNVI